MPSLANIYCHGVPSGLTLTGEVYPDGSDTVAETDASVVEEMNRKTTYVVNAGQSGLHKILLKSGSDVVWEGFTPVTLASTGNFNAFKTREAAIAANDAAAVQTSVNALPSADTNAAALLDFTNGVEGNLTVKQALRAIFAACAGKVSGAGTTTITIKNRNDDVSRLVATVDSDGNRTAITYDLD